MKKRLFACLLLAFMLATLTSCAISKGKFDNGDSDKSHLTSNKPNTGLIDTDSDLDGADTNTSSASTDSLMPDDSINDTPNSDLLPDNPNTDTSSDDLVSDNPNTDTSSGDLVPDNPDTDTSSDSQVPDIEPDEPIEPNGTYENPYPLNDDSTKITLNAGQSVYYYTDNGSAKGVLIENAVNISLMYGDSTYEAGENGNIDFKLPVLDVFNKRAVFKLTNKGVAQMELTLAFYVEPGTINAPKDLVLNKEINEEIANNQAAYYKWIANKNGILMVMSMSSGNNIRFNCTSTGLASLGTQGTICDYFYIEKDQEVLVEVASLNDGDTQVAFTVFCFTGKEETPIPVLKNEFEIIVPQGEAYYFICEMAGMKLSVDGENGTLIYNEEEYATSAEQKITLTQANNGQPIFFEIRNDGQENQAYKIKLTNE